MSPGAVAAQTLPATGRPGFAPRGSRPQLDQRSQGAWWPTSSAGPERRARACAGYCRGDGKPRLSGAFVGADDGARTHDLLHGKQILYQLIHPPAAPDYTHASKELLRRGAFFTRASREAAVPRRRGPDAAETGLREHRLAVHVHVEDARPSLERPRARRRRSPTPREPSPPAWRRSGARFRGRSIRCARDAARPSVDSRRRTRCSYR